MPSRRDFLAAVPVGFSTAALARAQTSETEEPVLWPSFPRQNPALVREVVGASHVNEEKVRDLVGKHPALANAAYDWGFGDWETALGAAAHTGRRNIAEFLLASGARLDIFAAAMLGQLDAVKAMIAATPGIQRTHGPHGIPLLNHAKAGGDAAKLVVEYLESLGDAGKRTDSTALGEQDQQQYIGTYTFGPGPTERFEVTTDKGSLWMTRTGDSRRGLMFIGDHSFFPVGTPAVRVRFNVTAAAIASLTVIDHAPIITAVRQ